MQKQILRILKSSIPFLIGLILGAGLTQRWKPLGWIVISYFVIIILSRSMGSTMKKIMKSKDKKRTIKQSGREGFDRVLTFTVKGNKIGANLFQKFYGEYVFWLNLVLVITLIVLLFNKQWMWSGITFFVINFFIILNQIWRKLKNVKTII